MSRAAEEYVNACTHPKVRSGTLALFKAIAELVPDGETTTTAVGMDALAARARLHRRTVVKRLADLVEIGEVQVIDGGQGRVARYTIVHVDGRPPIVAQPLPLRADLQPVERRVVRTDDQTGDLFDAEPAVRSAGEELVIQPVLFDHKLGGNLWRSITSWLFNLWRSITSWRSDGEKPVIQPVLIDHKLPAPDAVLTTARDVQQLKERTTTTAAPPDPPRPRAVESPPCRWFGTSHAWCLGRVHVPTAFHVEERRKLARPPGTTDAELDAQLFARYAEALAAIPDTAEIADKNEFAFWKRVLRSPSADALVPGRAPTAGQRRRDIANSRPCPHRPPCEGDTDACVDRQMAEWRAEQQRKSG